MESIGLPTSETPEIGEVVPEIRARERSCPLSGTPRRRRSVASPRGVRFLDPDRVHRSDLWTPMESIGLPTSETPEIGEAVPQARDTRAGEGSCRRSSAARLLSRIAVQRPSTYQCSPASEHKVKRGTSVSSYRQEKSLRPGPNCPKTALPDGVILRTRAAELTAEPRSPVADWPLTAPESRILGPDSRFSLRPCDLWPATPAAHANAASPLLTISGTDRLRIRTATAPPTSPEK